MNAVVLGCAYAMDVIAGDPEWLPHPVRGIGRLIAAGEMLTKPGRHSATRDLLQGALVTTAVVALTVAAAVGSRHEKRGRGGTHMST
jgi:adenosylcobinamide-phosphate synthase